MAKGANRPQNGLSEFVHRWEGMRQKPFIPCSVTRPVREVVRGFCRLAAALFPTRQGERSVQALSVCSAHSMDLSVWQRVQGFGMLSVFVAAGGMKRKVGACTFTVPSVSSISGMWQETHWLPALSIL